MTTPKIFTHRVPVVLLAIICCLLWGSAFPGVKTGYRLFAIGPDNTWLKLIFAGYRFFLASIFILVYALFSGQKMSFKIGDLKHILILGLFSTTFQYIFFYLGLSHISGVKASIWNSTAIFFTVIIAHFVFSNDRISKNKILGLILGFAGVAATNFSFELFKPDFTLFGDGFLIISQLAAAIGAVYVKKISGQIPVIALTAYQMLFGSLLLVIPAGLKVGFMPFHFTTANLTLYLYLALLSSVSFSIWNTLIKYNPVGKITMYQFLIPVIGALLSAVFLGDKIGLYTVVALLLVSVGIISVNREKPEYSPQRGLVDK